MPEITSDPFFTGVDEGPFDPPAEAPAVYACPGCGMNHPTQEGALGCCPTHECNSCGSYHYSAEDAHRCCRGFICAHCGEEYESHRAMERCCGDVTDETDPMENTVTPHLIYLDGPRAHRIVSVEQEISHGYEEVANLWHSHRSWHDEIKGDGSLADDGVEIEYSMMNLYEANQAQRFSSKIAAVRELRNRREIRTGSRAGTHIHVSAHDEEGNRITAKNLASIYGAFCHVEGAIYRLAACGWARHRREETSTDYAQILRKRSGGIKPKHTLTLQNPGERYYGLSYDRILQAVNYCQCGAVKVGDWADCECGYWDQATFEWRVFNTTTRAETLHAWIILAVSLTDHALRKDCSLLPIHGYDVRPDNESLQEQVDWIMNLPMSRGEREVMRKAIQMSPDLRQMA